MNKKISVQFLDNDGEEINYLNSDNQSIGLGKNEPFSIRLENRTTISQEVEIVVCGRRTTVEVKPNQSVVVNKLDAIEIAPDEPDELDKDIARLAIGTEFEGTATNTPPAHSDGIPLGGTLVITMPHNVLNNKKSFLDMDISVSGTYEKHHIDIHHDAKRDFVQATPALEIAPT